MSLQLLHQTANTTCIVGDGYTLQCVLICSDASNHDRFFVYIHSHPCGILLHDRLLSYAALFRQSAIPSGFNWVYDREPVVPYSLDPMESPED